ncbi:MAG: hypothetical protein GY816_22205, partial [Cytophagales bacterium]|nr:hypothetical protein [Cytophagales bacterium]
DGKEIVLGEKLRFKIIKFIEEEHKFFIKRIHGAGELGSKDYEKKEESIEASNNTEPNAEGEENQESKVAKQEDATQE